MDVPTRVARIRDLGARAAAHRDAAGRPAAAGAAAVLRLGVAAALTALLLPAQEKPAFSSQKWQNCQRPVKLLHDWVAAGVETRAFERAAEWVPYVHDFVTYW